VAAVAVGELYSYGHGKVLFKPTEAAQVQFRPMACDCMSYFVGSKAVTGGFDEDSGFAINGGKGWSNVVFDNHMIDVSGSTAIAMGNYYFTCATTGEVTKVEYTFGYKKCFDGKVRILLHHSSVPYAVPTSALTTTSMEEARASIAKAYYADAVIPTRTYKPPPAWSGNRRDEQRSEQRDKQHSDVSSYGSLLREIERLNDKQTADMEAKIKAEIVGELRQEILGEVKSLRKDLKRIELASADQTRATQEVLRGSAKLEAYMDRFDSNTSDNGIQQVMVEPGGVAAMTVLFVLGQLNKTASTPSA
jgi:hypothetical protein